MKEISYEGDSFKNEESAWLKNHRRTAPPTPAPIAEEKVPPPITRPLSPQSTPVAPEAPHVATPELQEDAEHEEHHLGMIIFVLTLVLAFGIGVGAYVLVGINKKPEPIPEAPTKTVEEVAPNTAQHTDILLTNSPRLQILVDVALAFKNTSLASGGVHHITFTVNNGKDGVRPATVGELFRAIRTSRVPDTLLNSLENSVTYEIPFGSPLAGRLTLSSRSPAHTFGALFDWEDSMARTLTPLLHPMPDTSYMNDLEGRKFHDERIGTIDARVLFDATDNVVIIYGFTDARTLVVAGNREVFLKNTLK